jgi:hypothetical protein
MSVMSNKKLMSDLRARRVREQQQQQQLKECNVQKCTGRGRRCEDDVEVEVSASWKGSEVKLLHLTGRGLASGTQGKLDPDRA